MKIEMRTSTQNLENDHIYVLKLIDVMRALTTSRSTNVSHIESIIDIIRNFADGLHHAKEEELFFPALEKKGFSASQGPVAVMLHEHVLGRNFVKGMTENLDQYNNGNKEAIDEVYHNMNGYADLLVNHISKENNILFRMADKVLSDVEQKRLLESFESIEKNRKEGMQVSDYVKRINQLALFYKV
jgi:hemerythrin-like domain-containing protein